MKNYLTVNCKLVIFCFTISFICLIVFAVNISPFTIYEGCDSCVFKQMGLAILSGKTPYLDLFDHKGPVIYFINAFGLWIGDRWGLFILNVINLGITLFFWNAIARLFVPINKSFFPVLLGLILLIIVMDGGNMTEDWCLLPLSYALYIASRMLVKQAPITFFESFAIGVCCGWVTFIRINILALIICSLVLVTYLTYYSEQRRLLKKYFIGTFLGFSLVTIVILIFFYFRYGSASIEQLIYGSFIYNIEYVNHPSMSTLRFFFLNCEEYRVFFILSIILCVYGYSYSKNSKQYHDLIIVYFLILSFVFSYLTLGRRPYLHYLITVTPLYVLAASYTFKESVREYFLSIFLISFFCVRSITYNPWQIYGSWKEIPSSYKKADLFIKNLDEGDKSQIWNYNTFFTGLQLLQHNKITQCNRVPHYHMLYNSTSLWESEMGKLEIHKPKYILIDPTRPYIYKEDSIFLLNEYICKDIISKDFAIYELRH